MATKLGDYLIESEEDNLKYPAFWLFSNSTLQPFISKMHLPVIGLMEWVLPAA
jgi:hypothetical protein